MSSVEYVAEKLWAAVDMLEDDQTPLRERLEDAVTGALIRLEPDDFEDQEDLSAFEALMARATNFQAVAGEGDIAASLHLLSDVDAEQFVADLRSLQRKYPFPG